MTKFTMLSVSKSRPAPVVVDGRQINFDNEIKTLGLSLRRTGIVKHLGDRARIARNQTSKIKRFVNLSTQTKRHLYKALIQPVIEYPIIPVATASDTQLLKLQRIQNKNIKFMVANDTELCNKTLQECHEKLELDPVNRRSMHAWRSYGIK